MKRIIRAALAKQKMDDRLVIMKPGDDRAF